MEFKGTKGKWEIYWDIQYPDILISTDEANIATVDSWDYDTTYEEESKANALLISKAPEMLEMLKKIHKTTLDEDIKCQVELLIKEATEL
jgi:hypothetical protein